MNHKKAIEILLYMTDRPLSVGNIKKLLDKDSPSEEVIRSLIREMNQEYIDRESPVQVAEVAGGFQLSTQAEYGELIRELYKEKTIWRLSASALETLSIVSYKQPITRGEIEEIRGVEATGVLETLQERKLVRVVGRKETVGRPLLFGTTMDFLRQFGIKSLSDLPKLEEFEVSEEKENSPEEGESVPVFAAAESNSPEEGTNNEGES